MLSGVFKIYRWVISPFIHTLAGAGAGCRFQPTCSAYSEEALRQHGWLRGSMVALKRILRCHPWGAAGMDPVPTPRARRT